MFITDKNKFGTNEIMDENTVLKQYKNPFAQNQATHMCQVSKH